MGSGIDPTLLVLFNAGFQLAVLFYQQAPRIMRGDLAL